MSKHMAQLKSKIELPVETQEVEEQPTATEVEMSPVLVYKGVVSQRARSESQNFK